MNIDLTDLQGTDIYLIDQILKRRLSAGQKILDVGCGSGRNLGILEKLGLDIHGVDLNPSAIEQCQNSLTTFSIDKFFCGDILELPFPTHHFDVVLCNALFHFAPDKQTFMKWANKSWEVLKPGGLFFSRLSTKIGLPHAQPPGFNYLADEIDITELEQAWGAKRLDPLKTTLVESSRTMTTWVLIKP